MQTNLSLSKLIEEHYLLRIKMRKPATKIKNPVQIPTPVG
jgi:hypothetical protein